MEFDLLQIAISVAGPFLAGWAGVRFGAVSTRLNRAFDRRLEWTEQTYRSIHRCIVSITAMDVAAEHKEMDDAYGAFSAALNAFQVLVVEADLFASRRTCETLRAVMEVVGNITMSNEVADEAYFQQLNHTLKIAAVALADDARRHLGLERLRIDRQITTM